MADSSDDSVENKGHRTVSTQKIDLHIPRNHTATTDGRPSNRHIFRDFMLHRWKRCRQLFTLVSDSIGWPLYSSDGDGTKQVVNFLAVRNNIEVARTGVALLDTGSDLDWISSEFANRLGVVFQSSSRVIIAETVTGEPVYSLGMIEGRWRCVDRPCRPRFEVSTFYIIDSPSIDIGIGKETLQRTGLYRRNSALVAAFRPHIPRAKATQVGAEARRAEEEARQAEERREKDRQAMADNEARKEARSSKPG